MTLNHAHKRLLLNVPSNERRFLAKVLREQMKLLNKIIRFWMLSQQLGHMKLLKVIFMMNPSRQQRGSMEFEETFKVR